MMWSRDSRNEQDIPLHDKKKETGGGLDATSDATHTHSASRTSNRINEWGCFGHISWTRETHPSHCVMQ